MKFSFEHELLSAYTDNLVIAQSLLKTLEYYSGFNASTISKTESVVKENFTTEIPNDKYLTITADDITCGGESVTEYNGEEIWNRDGAIEYVREADELFHEEHKAHLLELHVIQANNIAGEPMPDPVGKTYWLRCVFEINGERKITPWVFQNACGSVSDCGSGCACCGGNNVRYYSSFRGGLFGSVGN